MHLDKITLATADLSAVHAFYGQLLGLPVLHASAAQVCFGVGTSQLCFVKTSSPAFYHFAFLIPGNQIEEALHWIAAKTHVLPFDEQSSIANFKNWNAQAFYFHDYSKNILEFIVHHDLQNETNIPFSATSILSICEIGIPVHSVAAACNYFEERHHIPYFEKGPRLHDFAVVGEEAALLIVTAIGRGWLPTQRLAEKHYLQIELTHNGTTICLTNDDLPQ